MLSIFIEIEADAQECNALRTQVCRWCGDESDGCQRTRRLKSESRCTNELKKKVRPIGSDDMDEAYVASLLRKLCGHSRPTPECVETQEKFCTLCGAKGKTCSQIQRVRKVSTCLTSTMEYNLMLQNFSKKTEADRRKLMVNVLCPGEGDTAPASRGYRIAVKFVDPGRNLLAERLYGRWRNDTSLSLALTGKKGYPLEFLFQRDERAPQRVASALGRLIFPKKDFKRYQKALAATYVTGSGILTWWDGKWDGKKMPFDFCVYNLHFTPMLDVFLDDTHETMIPFISVGAKGRKDDRLILYKWRGYLNGKHQMDVAGVYTRVQ